MACVFFANSGTRRKRKKCLIIHEIILQILCLCILFHNSHCVLYSRVEIEKCSVLFYLFYLFSLNHHSYIFLDFVILISTSYTVFFCITFSQIYDWKLLLVSCFSSSSWLRIICTILHMFSWISHHVMSRSACFVVLFLS